MRNFFHVARNTFRECLREPIFFILLVSAITIIGLFPTLTLFVFREQVKLVIDSAMATTLVFGLVTAVLCASHTVSREISNGTVLLLLSKPVSRWSFIVSKIVGILAALTVFVFICNGATLISLRIAKDQFQLDYLTFYTYFGLIIISVLWGAWRNYFSRKSFPAATIIALMFIIPIFILISPFLPSEGKITNIHIEVLPALMLLFFAVWAMGAVSVMISAKLDMVGNLLVSSVFFFSGLVSDYFLADSAGTFSFKSFLYAIIPNWQFFWLADALSNKKIIPLEYIAWSGLYIILYIAFCSIIAITLFSDKEIAENVK